MLVEHGKGLPAAAALGPMYPNREDVGAKHAPVLVVGAIAPLGEVVDRPRLAAGHRGDEVGPGAGPLDQVSVRLDERKRSEFAGVGARRLRYSRLHGHGAHTSVVEALTVLVWSPTVGAVFVVCGTNIRVSYAFVKVFSRVFCYFTVELSPEARRQKGGLMPTMAPVKIGKNLKRVRERRLLTQAELGEAAGVNRDQVSRIERDEVEPRFSTIRKLAKALEVDPAELVGD